MSEKETASSVKTAPATKKAKKYSRNFSGQWKKTPDRLLGVGLIRLYQLTLSGFIGNSCRHMPTCSEYGYEAVARYGLWAGSWMTFFRIIRCGPFGTHGIDRVPEELRPDQHWYMPWRYYMKHECQN